ncbi:MAG: transposase [Rhodoplanes sp.]
MDRTTDHRRRHPGSAHPQRPSPHLEGRQHGNRCPRSSERCPRSIGITVRVQSDCCPQSSESALTQRQRARNRRFGKVRAKVEHVFRVLKCQFGYRKVRYRGIAKNGAQVFALLALANLYLARGRLASA